MTATLHRKARRGVKPRRCELTHPSPPWDRTSLRGRPNTFVVRFMVKDGGPRLVLRHHHRRAALRTISPRPSPTPSTPGRSAADGRIYLVNLEGKSRHPWLRPQGPISSRQRPTFKEPHRRHPRHRLTTRSTCARRTKAVSRSKERQIAIEGKRLFAIRRLFFDTRVVYLRHRSGSCCICQSAAQRQGERGGVEPNALRKLSGQDSALSLLKPQSMGVRAPNTYTTYCACAAVKDKPYLSRCYGHVQPTRAEDSTDPSFDHPARS